jgi:hypothetical protein
MVVGPGSIHPETKQRYILLHDRPIAQVTPEQLLKALQPFLIKRETEARVEEAARVEKSSLGNIDLDILEVVSLAGLKRQGDEYFGPHPVHGSTTGRNFWVNPRKNVWHCFPPDHLVITPDGLKEIQKLQVGESVASFRSKARITATFRRYYNGEILEIQPWYLPKFKVTPEHPLLVARCKRCVKRYEQYVVCRPNCPRRKKDGEHGCSGAGTPSIMWVNAADVNAETDFLIVPIAYDEQELEIDLASEKKYFSVVPDSVPLNKEMAFIIGTYLAEGHVAPDSRGYRSHIQFTLNFSEYEKGLHLKRLLERWFNIKANVYRYKRRGITLVNAVSTVLGRWLIKNLGTGSTNKTLGKFLNAKKELLKCIIDAYIHGGGYFNKAEQQWQISTVSKRLAHEVHLALIRLGKIPTSSYSSEKNNPRSKKGRYIIRWIERRKKFRHWVEGDNLFVPIKWVKRTQYSGYVHNLETTTHDYLAPFVSHNCFRHGTGGGPLLWLAVEEGIIQCEDAGPGALRGETFKKVLEAAVRRGLLSEDAVKSSLGNFNIGGYRFAVSDKDFMLYDKKGACVFTCKLPFLNSSRNKRQIRQITGASEAEVERAIASFLEHVKAGKEKREEEHEEPSKLVLEELERQKAVRLHPLMDYHPQIGYSIGIFPLGGRKSLVFLAEKPFVSNSETIQIQEPQPMLIHVKRLSWVKLHEEHAYILLQIAREFFEKGEIAFPAKSEVFSEVFGKILYYWWYSDERYYVLVACWVIGTYFHRLFAFYPALNPQGQRQTGKTTLLDVITQCAWNPTGRETAVREADLFRTIEGTRGTYVLDITMLDKSKDTRDVIDVIETGTEAGGRVRRIHPKTGKPMEFETYGPKAIATRYELPFLAKCIRIITEQAPSPEYAKRRALIPFDKDWLRIKELLVKAAIKYWREVKEAYESLEQTDKLYGRAFNYWAPLLAVCKVFAPEKFNGLLKLAEEDAEKAEKGDRLSEVESAVLAVLSEEVKDKKEEQKTVTVLLKDLTQRVQDIVPWVKDWHIVVSALENLGVIQRKYQTSKGVQYQISLERVKREGEQRRLKGEVGAETQANAIPPSGKEYSSSPSTQEEYISLDDLVSVYWKEEALTEKKCGVCGYVKPTVWEAVTTKGQVIAICEDCVREYQKRRDNVDDA